MTKPNLAIETFSFSENNADILLIGIDNIDKANIYFSEAHYYKYITDNNSVKNVMGIGPENKFFYKIAAYKDNNLVSYEYGVGYAYDLDGSTYFKRETPMLYGKNENHQRVLQNSQSRFYSPPGAINIITSEIPPNNTALYFEKNSILASKDAFLPHPIKILDNSFLARVSEDDLSSLSFDSKDFSDIVVTALTKYTKQLALKCSKLNANKLAVKQLQLESSDGAGAKAGTFVYDNETDTVKFYNGNRWRTLKWADEENPE
jgi:hypothetical protein